MRLELKNGFRNICDTRNNTEKTDSNQKARILVICPYNKCEDWQNDIRRQLGRYAHVVAQGDNGAMYRGDLKKIFLKRMNILL